MFASRRPHPLTPKVRVVSGIPRVDPNHDNEDVEKRAIPAPESSPLLPPRPHVDCRMYSLERAGE